METTLELNIGRVSRGTEALIRGIGIPPCPEVLSELLEEMGRDEPDLRHVGLLIGTDAGLAAAILKTVNSPLYGLATKASTVRHALALAGLKAAGQLLTGYYLRQAFAHVRGKVVEDFWNASSRAGLISACLSRLLGIGDRDEAHTFGLFRDCGMPVLRGQIPDYDRVAAVAAASDQRFTDVEQNACGVDHACVGAALAQSWGLANHVAQAIVWHHVHEVLGYADAPIIDRSKELIALALLASRMAAGSDTECREWEQGGPHALAYLGLTPERFESLRREILSIER